MITSAVKLKLKLQDFCTWLPYFIVFILVSMHLNHQLILIRTRYLKEPFLGLLEDQCLHIKFQFLSAPHTIPPVTLKARKQFGENVEFRCI